MSVKEFHGVPIVSATPSSAVQELLGRVANGLEPTSYRLLNAATFNAAFKHPEYRRLLSSAEGINLPDGKPLASVVNRTPPFDSECLQIRGQAFFEEVMDLGREVGLRHFFLGTTDETLARLIEQAELRFPGVQIVGTFTPPFRTQTPDELRAQDSVIAASGANMVWVALGTPKQDLEAMRITRSTGLTTAAVGAAFDFTAGTKRIAPRWMQKTNLEWFFRFASEPRRLWRRYLIGNAHFIALSLSHFRSLKK